MGDKQEFGFMKPPKARVLSKENLSNGYKYLLSWLQDRTNEYRRHALVFIDTMRSSTFACELLLKGDLIKRSQNLTTEYKPTSRIRMEAKFGKSEKVSGTFSFGYPKGGFNFTYYQPLPKHWSLQRDEKVRGYLYKKFFENYRTTLQDSGNIMKGTWDHW